MPENVVVSLLEVFPFQRERTAVCVVRCLEGTAALGMRFIVDDPSVENAETRPELTLGKVEWYGKDVEQLDTGHSGKITLLGEAAERLAPGMRLTSAR